MKTLIRTAAIAAAVTMSMFSLSAQAIFNGTEVQDGDPLLNQAMAIGMWSAHWELLGATPGPGGRPQNVSRNIIRLGGTGMVIEHLGISERCLMTAKHIKLKDEHGIPRYDSVVMGTNVRQLIPEDRDQLVAKNKTWESETTAGPMPPGTRDPYRDFRIVWVENRADDGNDKKIRLEDYQGASIEVAPVPEREPGDEHNLDWRYDISGYGLKNASRATLGIHRSGSGRITRLETREANLGGGARIQTWPERKGQQLTHFECQGDSGAAIRSTDGIFSAVSTSTNADCDPEFRKRNQTYSDPNDEHNFLSRWVILHSALNSAGAIDGDPDKLTAADWAEVGNWEQVQYGVSKVCTKEVEFKVQGSGTVSGLITGEPLRAYETDRLDHDVECVGENADIQTDSTGDCVEAVHQPEGLSVEAHPAEGWRFLRWSDGAAVMTDEGDEAPSLCPCEGRPDGGNSEICHITFDEIGHYDAHGSEDLSMCIAEFVRIPEQYEFSGPTQPYLSIH